MSGVKSARSPTKRSPASTSVHTRSTDQVSRAPGSGQRSSKPSRRRSAASVSPSSGSDSDEDTESPALARSHKKPGGRVMRIESSDSDDEALVNLAAPQNKSRLVEEDDDEEMGSTEEEDENMSRSFVARGGFMTESSDEGEGLSEDEDFIVKDADGKRLSSKEGSSEESFASAEEPNSRPASSSGNFDTFNKQIILTPPPTITPPRSSPSPKSTSASKSSAALDDTWASSPGGAGDDLILQITPPKSSPYNVIQITPPKSSPSPTFKPLPKPSVPKKR